MTKSVLTKADVLVIGGGVIGASIALFLTRAGRQVRLLEKAELCSGASHGNACWVAAGYAIPTAAPGVIKQGLRWMLDSSSPFQIKPRMSLDLLRWLWAFKQACTHKQMMKGAQTLLELNAQGLQLFRDLAAEFDFGFHEDGIIHVHLSEKYRDAGEQEAELMRGLGIEAKSLDREGLLKLEPHLKEGIESGVFFPAHAHLDPTKLVRVLAAQAEKEGAIIQMHTEVLGFEKEDDRIARVKTSEGDFEAQEVILAAGAWSSILAKQLGAPILMEPAKGYSVTVKKQSMAQGPSRPIAIDHSKVAITPLGQDRFRFSGTLELAGFDLSVNPDRLRVNRESLQAVLPDMESIDELETWSGYRPLTPDGLPFIGRSERLSNLVFATGHGMLGITHGPITAQLVTELLMGQSPSIPLEAMRPERF